MVGGIWRPSLVRTVEAIALRLETIASTLEAIPISNSKEDCFTFF